MQSTRTISDKEEDLGKEEEGEEEEVSKGHKRQM